MARVRLDDDVAEFFATVQPDGPQTALLHIERLQGSGDVASPYAFAGCIGLAESLSAALSAPDFGAYLGAQQ